jgi:hypothetical protein
MYCLLLSKQAAAGGSHVSRIVSAQVAMSTEVANSPHTASKLQSRGVFSNMSLMSARIVSRASIDGSIIVEIIGATFRCQFNKLAFNGWVYFP